jgi:hypothetical protein
VVDDDADLRRLWVIGHEEGEPDSIGDVGERVRMSGGVKARDRRSGSKGEVDGEE